MKDTCKIIALAMLLLGVSASASLAEQSADPDQAQTESNDRPAPPAYVDVMNPDVNKSATDTDQSRAESKGIKVPADVKPVSPRGFVDVFYGSVTTADDYVTATSQGDCFLFCSPPTDYGQQAHFRKSSVFGVRVGGWLKDYPAIGLAADFSFLNAKAPGVADPSSPWTTTSGVSIRYMPISFVFLARYSLLRTDPIPDGRIQLYGGLMLSAVIGEIDVNGVEGSSTDFGFGTLLGLAWHFPSFAVFGEYRMMQVSLDYDSSEDDWISFGTTAISADLDTKQLVYGVSFKF